MCHTRHASFKLMGIYHLTTNFTPGLSHEIQNQSFQVPTKLNTCYHFFCQKQTFVAKPIVQYPDLEFAQIYPIGLMC